MEEDIEKIPEGVTDEESYREWLKLTEEFNLLKDQYYQTSDPTIKLPKTTSSFFLQERIKHLPEEEQKRLKKEAEEINKLRGYVASFKRKAFAIIDERGKMISGKKFSTLENYKVEIIELFGRFYSIAEIYKIINDKWGISLGKEALTKFKLQHSDEISIAQERYKNDLSEIRLTYKKSRLEELSHLYVVRKDIYTTSTSREDYKLLLQTLEQIRKEVEGDRILIEGKLKFEEERVINLYIQEEVLKFIPVKSMIIAMVAARLNQNPLYVMSRLINSYYARFTGMIKSDLDLNQEKLFSPSEIVWNFDDIGQQFLLRKEEEEKLKLLPSSDNKEAKEKVENIRNTIVRKLVEKKRHIDQQQNQNNLEE